MADKSNCADMIRAAPRPARRRRIMPRAEQAPVKEASRLSHWPPERWAQWRTDTLTPWKVKPWKVDDWN